MLSITKLADINYKLHLTRPKNFVMLSSKCCQDSYIISPLGVYYTELVLLICVLLFFSLLVLRSENQQIDGLWVFDGTIRGIL